MIEFVTIAQSILILVLGGIVLLRDSKSQLNRSFFLLTLLISVWIIASGFGGRISNEYLSINLVRLDYISGFYIAWALLRFSLTLRDTFTSYYFDSRTQLALMLSLLFGLGPTWGNILQVYNESGEIVALTGRLFIPLYAIPVTIIILVAASSLRKTHRDTKKALHDQVQVIYKSLVSSAIVVAVSSLVIESLLDSDVATDTLQLTANFGLMIFAIGSTYAIVKHRFFDIRSVFARLIGYLLAIAAWSFTYSIVVFLGLKNIIGDETFNQYIEYFLFITSVILAVSYQPLLGFFRKITDRVFFQDVYDPQSQINKLSNLVVSKYEIDELCQGAIEVIDDTVRPDGGVLVLLDHNKDFYESYEFASPAKFDLDSDALGSYVNQTETIKVHDPYSTDIQTKTNESIRISVLMTTHEGVAGAILLGPKRSGGQYNYTDLKFLEIAANELAIAIQNARRYDEIKRFNETLRLEVDRATAELRESNRKLKELDEAKDEFVTMASHQLRTPLTSVKGYISMVMEGDAGKISDRQRELLQNAFTSSQRMVYLIADLLNVSRLKTGKFVIETKRVNLKQIVEGEIEQLKETARARGLKLSFKSPKVFPDVELDDNKTRQVIMNFIDNAIFYTPSGGKIDVSLSNTKDSIEFKVKDTGIGVPKEERQNLFTKFYRANNARKARPDGTGLGLFMAKKVIVAQGGAIIFDSKEGHGSTFGFSFPLARVGIKKSKKTKKSSRSKAKPKSKK